jgi:(p)ppGpp synthase/HD superfamily hydrolase
VGADLGDRFAAALAFAWEQHRYQRRKATGAPYLGHVLGVAALVIDDGGTEDEAIAALLHDAIEDATEPDRVRDEIGHRFGAEVLRVVVACSDSFEYPKRPWIERKRAFVESLHDLDAAVARVATADKLQNARALVAEVRADGPAVFDLFNGGRSGTLWYYRAVADRLATLAPGTLAGELLRAVGELESLAGLPAADAER